MKEWEEREQTCRAASSQRSNFWGTNKEVRFAERLRNVDVQSDEQETLDAVGQ